eukprot:1631497-Rhodomonas_salina.1
MASSYNIGYIIVCSSALHLKYNLLRAESVVAGTGFEHDVNLNKWTEAAQVAEMTEYFQKEE